MSHCVGLAWKRIKKCWVGGSSCFCFVSFPPIFRGAGAAGAPPTLCTFPPAHGGTVHILRVEARIQDLIKPHHYHHHFAKTVR